MLGFNKKEKTIYDDLKIVHQMSASEDGSFGPSFFLSHEKFPDIIFCYTNIQVDGDNKFICDTSLITLKDKEVSENSINQAAKYLDDFFIAGFKKAFPV